MCAGDHVHARGSVPFGLRYDKVMPTAAGVEWRTLDTRLSVY